MIYPRIAHRHIAITALYILLTLGVLGLIIILCVFNDSEHTYLFESGLTNEKKLLFGDLANLKHIKDQDHYLRNYNKSIIATTPKQNTKYKLKNNSNSEQEQQHIYIDELYTENTKPKRVLYTNYINYSKLKITAETKKIDKNMNYKGSGSENHKKFGKFPSLPFDDDTDDNDNDEKKIFYQNEINNDNYNDNENNNDNENVASGSGGSGSQFMEPYNKNTNENYNMETQKFIKRISMKLLELSKRNTSDEASANSKDQLKHDSRNRKRQRKKKHFRPGSIESKINFYRSVELTTSHPSSKLKSISKWSQQSVAPPLWTATQIKTRRIIGNQKKSAERSRQLLLCEKGKSGGGGGELCRMLFKEA